MTDAEQPQSPPNGPWQKSFTVDGVAGGPVKLHQIGKKTFVLKSDIHYSGETGLEDTIDADTMEDIRSLSKGIETDLASVPGPLRWFLGTYGAHTPAVLIHDRLIPTPDELEGKMTDQYADRYLRFMAKDVGMRWLRRWVMWSGVALRTRWAGGGLRKLTVVLWMVAAVFGMLTFAGAAADGDVGRMLLATLGMLVAAGLWDRQYGAGVIGGITAPWLLPPAILAAIGLGIYVVLEFALGWIWGWFGKTETRGSGSYGAEGL
jgi:hypothetical protein